MIDRWNYPPREGVQFEGAWDPYVRDFDPTLNKNFMVCDEAPIFNAINEHTYRGIQENKSADISTAKARNAWLETQGVFFKELKETLILEDGHHQQWVCLTKYCETGRKDLNEEKLLVWSWLYAYFVMPEQFEGIKKSVEEGLSVITRETASHHQTYTLFSREYPWSPGCKEFEEQAWVDLWVKSGEDITEEVQVPYYPQIEELLCKYGGLTDDEMVEDTLDYDKLTDDKTESSSLLEAHIQKETRRREAEKHIGKILHATTDLEWEEEYDATKETPINCSMPCGKLIEEMGLRQMTADGFYFDSDDKLAAFDTDLTQNGNCVVVRKDILDSFLSKTGMKLLWLVDASKEIHAGDYSIANWREWEAVFSYEGGHVSGEIHTRKE